MSCRARRAHRSARNQRTKWGSSVGKVSVTTPASRSRESQRQCRRAACGVPSYRTTLRRLLRIGAFATKQSCELPGLIVFDHIGAVALGDELQRLGQHRVERPRLQELRASDRLLGELVHRVLENAVASCRCRSGRSEALSSPNRRRARAGRAACEVQLLTSACPSSSHAFVGEVVTRPNSSRSLPVTSDMPPGRPWDGERRHAVIGHARTACRRPSQPGPRP